MFSVYVVWPSVLSLNNLKILKIHKTKAVKKTFVYKKIYISVNFYNPGLALAGFQTTPPPPPPCLQQVNLTRDLDELSDQA